MTHSHIELHELLFVVFELQSLDIRPVEVLEVFMLLDVRNSIFGSQAIFWVLVE